MALKELKGRRGNLDSLYVDSITLNIYSQTGM